MSVFVRIEKSKWDLLIFNLESKAREYARRKEYLEVTIELLKKNAEVIK